MRAVVYAGPGKVRVDDVPEPTLQGSTDAIVRVNKTAICGSDLHLLDGKTPGMREGGVIGHEFVGIVTEVGDQVAHTEGTRVLGSFLIACGKCPACEAKRFNFCLNRRALGLGTLTGDLDGAQAGYVRVPDADLNLKLLDGALSGLDDEQALFGGDVMTTGFYAAALTECRPEETAVVVGAGPLGLFAAGALQTRARKVLVLDTDPARVDEARRILSSAEAALVTDDPFPVVAEATSGALADVVVEAVGSVAAFKSSLKLVREGGRVVVIGVYGTERYELALGKAWVRGIDIRFGGMANIHAHWDTALMTVAKGELDPTAPITHRLSLDDAEEGYELFAARKATKVVLSP